VPSVLKALDLTPLLEQHTSLPRSTALLDETGLRTLLLHLRAGEQMPEHATPGAITVQCLSGETEFRAGTDATVMSPGMLLSLPASVPHDLTARTESVLLVTIQR
jgi:quercetin dioxygenase-like cupin family protein